MINSSSFKPAWWLAGAHAQTIWPYYFRVGPDIPIKWERLTLPDSDFIDLVWGGNNQGPVVLVMHGLEGSVRSHYSRGILDSLSRQGWQAVLMHFRGCSGEHNRLARGYHSGETGDIRYVINTLKSRYPDRFLAAVGFSLGGNALLKYLGEEKSQTPLVAAVTVSVPFDLSRAADRLDKGFSRLYQRHLVRQLHNRIIEKFRDRNDAPFSLTDIAGWKSFHLFDNYVTAPLHGFSDSRDYYQRSSSKQFLHKIEIPTLLIQAKDDPFLPQDALPDIQDMSAHVTLELSEKGGHAGFIYGMIPGKAKYWLDNRIPRFLKGFLD